ncbi:MAG: hypothetical protein AAGF87_09090 [Bacteroidota bacterium]
METTTSPLEVGIDFLASCPSPEDIIAFKVDREVSDRLEALALSKSSGNSLSTDEQEELRDLITLNRILKRAKLRAFQLVNK